MFMSAFPYQPAVGFRHHLQYTLVEKIPMYYNVSNYSHCQLAFLGVGNGT